MAKRVEIVAPQLRYITKLLEAAVNAANPASKSRRSRDPSCARISIRNPSVVPNREVDTADDARSSSTTSAQLSIITSEPPLLTCKSLPPSMARNTPGPKLWNNSLSPPWKDRSDGFARIPFEISVALKKKKVGATAACSLIVPLASDDPIIANPAPQDIIPIQGHQAVPRGSTGANVVGAVRSKDRARTLQGVVHQHRHLCGAGSTVAVVERVAEAGVPEEIGRRREENLPAAERDRPSRAAGNSGDRQGIAVNVAVVGKQLRRSQGQDRVRGVRRPHRPSPPARRSPAARSARRWLPPCRPAHPTRCR